MVKGIQELYSPDRKDCCSIWGDFPKIKWYNSIRTRKNKSWARMICMASWCNRRLGKCAPRNPKFERTERQSLARIQHPRRYALWRRWTSWSLSSDGHYQRNNLVAGHEGRCLEIDTAIHMYWMKPPVYHWILWQVSSTGDRNNPSTSYTLPFLYLGGANKGDLKQFCKSAESDAVSTTTSKWILCLTWIDWLVTAARLHFTALLMSQSTTASCAHHRFTALYWAKINELVEEISKEVIRMSKYLSFNCRFPALQWPSGV